MLKTQSMAHWLHHRDANYIASRAVSLVKRYGITPATAQRRILEGMNLFARHGCSPTFPTPGRVVDAHPEFCRTVQQMGAELAVHGYDHVDFRSLSTRAAHAQFATAVRAFEDAKIEVAGFRCPYLSYDPSLSKSLPANAFRYSSNRAVWWDVLTSEMTEESNSIFKTLQSFYRAASADTTIVTPRLESDVVEIPASLPDDLQLYDGLGLDIDSVKRVWMQILDQTHERGELFALLFHPESFSQSGTALETILIRALELNPHIWIARLKDVSEWWHEKSRFSVDVMETTSGLHLQFNCSQRATVLARGFTSSKLQDWYCRYSVLEGRELFVPGMVKPFIGVEQQPPMKTVRFLREQGYIVESSDAGRNCSLFLSNQQLGTLSSELEVIKLIESHPARLVRYWRWPAKARSALSFTGDLDALCLVDYLKRLLPSSRNVN